MKATVHSQLARIAKEVTRIELTYADTDPEANGEEGPSEYTRSDRVFAMVKPLLAKRSVTAIPVRTSTEPAKLAGGKMGARAVVDVQFAHAPSGTSTVASWPGEASSAAGAATNALKGLYLATFLIPTLPRPKGPRISEEDLSHYIYPLREKSGLTVSEFTDLLEDLYGVKHPEDLSAQLGRDLRIRLHEVKTVERYKHGRNGATATEPGQVPA